MRIISVNIDPRNDDKCKALVTLSYDEITTIATLLHDHIPNDKNRADWYVLRELLSAGRLDELALETALDIKSHCAVD